MVDLKLVAAQAARGDHAAFRRIVDHTRDGMYRLACRMLGDAAEADDALQEAYLKAYQALRREGFAGHSRLETWIYRIVTNACLDALRRRKSKLRERVDRSDEAPGSPEQHLALRELDQWLGGLPAEQRAVVVLRCVEGLSTAEAADALGISQGAVEQRLVRARATLREIDERA